jgi:hypothetical protein
VRKSIVIFALSTVSLATCVTVGVAIYKWFKDGDKVACIATEFNFGCSTTLGWLLSAVGVVFFVGIIILWERFRGK